MLCIIDRISVRAYSNVQYEERVPLDVSTKPAHHPVICPFEINDRHRMDIDSETVRKKLQPVHTASG